MNLEIRVRAGCEWKGQEVRVQFQGGDNNEDSCADLTAEAITTSHFFKKGE